MAECVSISQQIDQYLQTPLFFIVKKIICNFNPRSTTIQRKWMFFYGADNQL